MADERDQRRHVGGLQQARAHGLVLRRERKHHADDACCDGRADDAPEQHLREDPLGPGRASELLDALDVVCRHAARRRFEREARSIREHEGEQADAERPDGHVERLQGLIGSELGADRLGQLRLQRDAVAQQPRVDSSAPAQQDVGAEASIDAPHERQGHEQDGKPDAGNRQRLHELRERDVEAIHTETVPGCAVAGSSGSPERRVAR